MLQRYPYLSKVPPGAPNGVDTPLPPPPAISWEGLGNLIPVNPSLPPSDDKPAESQRSENEDTRPPPDGGVGSTSKESDVEDTPTTWHGVALSIAAELMGKAREAVKVKLGYTTSAVSLRINIGMQVI